MLFMAFMVCLVVGSSVLMLYLNTKISTQQNNISALEAELEKIEDDNAAHKLRLNNMYTLDDIYNVATNELGMVYAKKGQIIYYDSANEDYVKQYQDVPGSN
jgi:septum formation initiator